VIDIDLGNFVFFFAMVLGLTLLLVTVVLDDIVGGILDGLNVDLDIGGVGVAPIALGFVAMFGIGGLFGTMVLHLGSAWASILGVGLGAAGGGLVFAMFSMLTRSQAPEAYSVSDMVGITGHVVVGIPKGRMGEVVVSFAGATQKKSATADADIPAGAMVTVTAVAGSILVVEAGSRKEPTEQ
jgi:membrane-bound ClpP family serine protease